MQQIDCAKSESIERLRQATRYGAVARKSWKWIELFTILLDTSPSKRLKLTPNVQRCSQRQKILEQICVYRFVSLFISKSEIITVDTVGFPLFSLPHFVTLNCELLIRHLNTMWQPNASLFPISGRYYSCGLGKFQHFSSSSISKASNVFECFLKGGEMRAVTLFAPSESYSSYGTSHSITVESEVAIPSANTVEYISWIWTWAVRSMLRCIDSGVCKNNEQTYSSILRAPCDFFKVVEFEKVELKIIVSHCTKWKKWPNETEQNDIGRRKKTQWIIWDRYNASLRTNWTE